MKIRGQSFVALAISLLTNVYAQAYDNIERGSIGVANLFISAFGPLFFILLGNTQELLFERILLFFVIISVVYMVIKEMDLFKSNKAIIFIVTFSVSLLAIRFIKITELVYSVILPYSVLGVGISSFLPLVISFAFIHNIAPKSAFLRKTFWILLAVIFVSMWDLTYAATGPTSWMYFWCAVLCLIFFLLDGTIRRQIVKSRMQAAGIEKAEDFARKIRRDLGQLEIDYKDHNVDDRTYRRIKRRLSRQLEELLKH